MLCVAGNDDVKGQFVRRIKLPTEIKTEQRRSPSFLQGPSTVTLSQTERPSGWVCSGQYSSRVPSSRVTWKLGT